MLELGLSGLTHSVCGFHLMFSHWQLKILHSREFMFLWIAIKN